MLIKRLYLRNFRVYEDELDLEVPPGLVGIYGPNGAGKSTLLEAILFTLWGKSRTTKEQIRSAGVGGDCVTEVEFEHEGHLYLVRRTLKGVNSTVTVEAHCDGSLMSTGTRDAERYVESVLGMDDGAFRASVFTEQKQLAAFSSQSPAERRRLVLQLLGITPLDAARDEARKDARRLAADHDRLRGMLPDLSALGTEAADSAARADAREVAAAEEATSAEVDRARAEAATAAHHAVDIRRQEHESLVAEGRAARSEADAATKSVESLRSELDRLRAVATTVADIEVRAAGLEHDEARLEALRSAFDAASAAEAVTVPPPPDPVPEGEHAEAVTRAEARQRELAACTALLKAAEADERRTKELTRKSASLSGEADCPTCGQALGDAFGRVQAHRESEAEEAANRRCSLTEEAARLETAALAARSEASELAERADKARTLHAAWDQARLRKADAEEASGRAWDAFERIADGGWSGVFDTLPSRPASRELSEAVTAARELVASKRELQSQALAARVKLERLPEVEAAFARAVISLEDATARVEALREKVRAIGYRPDQLQQAAAARDAAEAAARRTAASAQSAAIAAAQERARATAAAEHLAEGRAQHEKLADLESESRHRSRAAELLSEFRNTVVASVGPRLAAQAADLFGELTDHEYDGIEVDPDTYQLQISDAGRTYGLDRFSGSEIDLANLALRVAISEHIHFQSGGSVGLLVLDEVFGPLDEDRKGRMLLALERLKGRFRQVLVVTHDSEIKDQMPNAIEVVKLPGRRGTARVLGD